MYGVTAAESSIEIHNAFVRKVYTILFAQILGTCIVAALMSRSSAVDWIQTHTWAFYLPLFGTLVNLGLLYWKRHSHPINFVLLSTFTILESLSLGVAVSFYDQVIVLQALLITLGVFLGLTLFTLQSKARLRSIRAFYDFSGMGPYLFGGLIALLATGLVGIFVPFGQTMDLIYALFGCVLFSGYIIFDTFLITKRLSPDEYIMGAISLYLEYVLFFLLLSYAYSFLSFNHYSFINLFLMILRALNNVED
ncbi:hypothetical protein BOTBODRAFT_123747 [Botryobasidium botryosum FD-172 SS1]|uniref:Uncharacterized protein n=1 Tax=Botryobasidium botryosum (strain FD-172 SS1) TaxID=930990 RepID=A0A067N4I4_BOTB1|nr:hypothetical protein BOTBODRAFT_123747 [Botryobasidium botryosum FD-172 SS1]